MEFDFNHDITLPTIDKWIEHQIPIRLKYFKGNKTKTAISLGISQSTLYIKINKFEHAARMKRLNLRR